MDKCFVVVSGLPGSGKSTLARQLAPALGLSLLDKDAILERLFESKGAGNAEWRRALSRESDLILQAEAAASGGAVLVSHWHLPGMLPQSGTATGWLSELYGTLIHINCECSPEIAAERFVNRKRHAGHRDGDSIARRDPREYLSNAQAAEPSTLDIGTRIDLDTSQTIDLNTVLREIDAQINRHATGSTSRRP